MNSEIFFVGVILTIAFLAAVLLLVRRIARARRLSASLLRTLHAEFAGLDRLSDRARRVLEAEKIVDSALSALGYGGTFAEKLQRAGPRFSALQALWDAHKLRNRIAHERSVSVDDAQVKRALAAFERALKDLS